MHRRAVAAVALLLVVVAATVAILVVRQQPVPPPPDDPPAQTTRTLLVQVRDPSFLTLGSVLMGVEQDQRLDQLWWSTQWWIDQLGVQEVSAAELGRKPVPYVMQTVQDQVGVRVDDSWVLDRLAFAGLVDAVGGVRIDIAKPTTYRTEQDITAVLPAGIQNLSGAQATDFVLDSSLTDENVRLRRFQSVWDQVLRRFPTDAEKARALVVSLGALSKPTMPVEELSQFLSDAHDLRITGAYAQTRVRLDDTNGVRVRPPQGVTRAFAMDPLATADRMQGVFAAFPAPEDPVARVLAVTVRGASAEEVREQLRSRSWRSVWGGRSVTAVTTVTVDPAVTQAEVVGLEQALGITPETGELPLADALVALPAEAPLPVGL